MSEQKDEKRPSRTPPRSSSSSSSHPHPRRRSGGKNHTDHKTEGHTRAGQASRPPSGQARGGQAGQKAGGQTRENQVTHKSGRATRGGRARGTQGKGAQKKRSEQDYRFPPGQLAARAAALPVVTYPDLPVSARRHEIAAAIRDHQVVIVAGETGSGKTTQLPKICLELGRGIGAMIGHTQPRRLAARAVAERIADELGQKVGTEVGDVIGYQVRFTDEVGPTTLVKLMTDGILLAEMGTDPLLSRYDTLIVDEAHERSLNIDFILGYLSRLLPQRPDLKVIITSATIDAERFAAHFEKHTGTSVPTIEVSGRAYPVEVRYRPLAVDLTPASEEERADEPPMERRVVGTHLHPESHPGDYASLGYGLGEDLDVETALTHAVDELLTEERGDILVFLPGERDILEAQQALRDHLRERYAGEGKGTHRPDGIEVLPLFARLSAADQHRIYAPHSLQRIILATNIAETSLTVPGIRYVIDAGLARVSRFSPKTKVQRLPIEPVSQASAAQRAGRAGRTSPGIAIRLYSQRDFDKRDEFTQPEILRTSLASVILQMSALGLGEIQDFPFLDAPNPRAVRDGVQLLIEIGALSPEGQITPLGRRLARLPIDPRLGRMLVEADAQGCASEVLVIVAALSIQDPRERPVDAQEASDASHRRFADPTSDFITYLNMWRYLNVQARDLSGSAFRRMCRTEYFHYLRFREWRDIVGQLRQMCRQVGIHVDTLGLPSPRLIHSLRDEAYPAVQAALEYGASTQSVDPDQIHRSIVTGLLSNIGLWDEPKREYAGARGARFTIWPGSALRKRRPEWVMAAELVETSRLFARTVAGIQPEWVEKYAADLVKRSYSQPVWSRARGSAQVSEKVTLYGLTLIANRMVPLTRLGGTVLGREWNAPGGIGSAVTGRGQSAIKPSDLHRSRGLTAQALAREMFITHALVENEWRDQHYSFVRHNREVMAKAEELSDRMRDPSLVPDEAIRYRFFDARIPVHITSAAAFGKWWKAASRETPDLLDYRLEDLLPSDALLDPSAFPSTWRQGEVELEVAYSFTPGAEEDGVAITIPLSLLGRVHSEGFEWLVPGLLEELCVAMIRGLPKQKRRFLAPATQTGAEIAALLAPVRDGSRKGGVEGEGSGKSERDATSVDTGANSGAPVTSAREEANPYSLEASLDRLRSWGAASGQVSTRGAATSSRGKSSPSPSRGKAPTQDTPASFGASVERGERHASPSQDQGHFSAPTPTGHSSSAPPSTGSVSLASSPSSPMVPPFDVEFARAIRERSGIDVSPEDLSRARSTLPPHLRIGFRLVDDRGAIVGSGDSLPDLQRRFSRKADQALQSTVRDAINQARQESERKSLDNVGTPQEKAAPTPSTVSTPAEIAVLFAANAIASERVTTMPTTPIPLTVEARNANGLLVRGYPALVGTDEGVAVRIRSSAHEAQRDHTEGLIRLLLLDLALETGRVTSRWSGHQALLLAGSPYPDTPSLVDDAQLAAMRALVERFAPRAVKIRDVEAYADLRAKVRDQLEDEVYAVLTRVTQDVTAFAALQDSLTTHDHPPLAPVRREALRHARSLFHDGYLGTLDPALLPHISRYLTADAQRIEKAARGVTELRRDRELSQEMKRVEDEIARVRTRMEARPYSSAHERELRAVQGQAEELRVSLFAQGLGTVGRVSAQRLLRRLESVERE